MMMETVAKVIPHDVYSYVHAVDGRVDMGSDSIDGDLSPNSESSTSYYATHAPPSTLMNGTVDTNQMTQYSTEYQDPNAGGDHVEYSGDGVYESTPVAADLVPAESDDSYQEGMIYQGDDGNSYMYDAGTKTWYSVDPSASTVETAAEEPAEAQCAEAEAEAQYAETAAVEEAGVADADPAQLQVDENAYEAAPAEAPQGYYDDNGVFIFYEQAAQVEEIVYCVDQQQEASPEYAVDETAPCQQDGYADPTQYYEQPAVEGMVYPESYAECTSAENLQVDTAYAEPTYAAGTVEGLETELVSEVPPQVQESEVPPPAPEPVPAEQTYTAEEHQRDLDVAFFGVEQANALIQQDPAQDYQEAPVAEPYEGQNVEYAVSDDAQAYAYDPAQQPPEAYSQEVLEEQAALESYQGEVPLADGSEVPEAYEGDASQGEYQDPGYSYYLDEAGNVYYYHLEPCPEESEAAVDASAAYVDPGTATEIGAAVEYQENADTGIAPQDAEVAQGSVEATAETQEYVQYDQQEVAPADATYIEAEAVIDPSQQVCYIEEAVADQGQLGQYTEEVEQRYTEEYPVQQDASAQGADDGEMVADPACSVEATEAQNYDGQGGYAEQGSVADDTQAVQTYETVQGYLAEDGSPAPVDYAAGDVPQTPYAEEQYVQSDQGYLSEPANDSLECVVEAPEQQHATEEYQGQANGVVYDEASQQHYMPENGEQCYLPEQAYNQENVEQQHYSPEQQYTQENGQEYVDATQQQYVGEYGQQVAEGYEQHYTPEQLQEYAEQHPAELVQEEYIATEAHTEQYTEEQAGQDPQVHEAQPLTNGVHYPQQNGEIHGENLAKPGVSPHIVRGKPFTREMDSTEKFKNFRIEYERTPAFDAFGHCLKFLGVRRGFVCSIRTDGVVCMQLKGSQQDEWQETELEYDASRPAEKVEVGKMYIIPHVYEGHTYMERCRVKAINGDQAFIDLIDSGYDRKIAKEELFDIINLEEVERLPAQVVEIFVVGLTFQGYAKEDLKQLEREWSPYEEVFIIPVDAPQGGLIRTIVCRKTGETLGIRATPKIAEKPAV